MQIPAFEAVDLFAAPLAGLPVFIAGSSAAAARSGLKRLDYAFDDVDGFCATEYALISAAERLIQGGFVVHDRHQRLYQRWLKQGFSGWHTNSLKLTGPDGLEANLVYKVVNKRPVSSLSQVLESFDFGLLAVGYDCQDQAWRDMRPYFFPSQSVHDALPLLPLRRDDWRNGFISQYQGLREAGRYAKYAEYGWDMSLVKDDLLTGYREAALYLLDRDQVEKQTLGTIYNTIADHIEDDETAKLVEVGREIPFMDSLDLVMEALE